MERDYEDEAFHERHIKNFKWGYSPNTFLIILGLQDLVLYFLRRRCGASDAFFSTDFTSHTWVNERIVRSMADE